MGAMVNVVLHELEKLLDWFCGNHLRLLQPGQRDLARCVDEGSGKWEGKWEGLTVWQLQESWSFMLVYNCNYLTGAGSLSFLLLPTRSHILSMLSTCRKSIHYIPGVNMSSLWSLKDMITEKIFSDFSEQEEREGVGRRGRRKRRNKISRGTGEKVKLNHCYWVVFQIALNPCLIF